MRGPDPLPAREDCDYAPYYCEENVARLLARLAPTSCRAWALIVSNAAKAVAMLGQRAGRSPEGFVLWDYHVVALLRDDAASPCFVADFDSRLAFPSPGLAWLEASFPPRAEARMRPLFRLIPAALYLEVLASDRSHMRRPDGSWAAPPPPWPPFGEGRRSNLFELLDMSRSKPGLVLGLEELAALCAAPAGAGR